MREALLEAEIAASHADVPIGCIVVNSDGSELARAHNRRELDGDPTAHAEIIALRAAAVRRGSWRLDGCTLYATLEPCVMCAGALVNARIARLVFGAPDPKAGAIASLYAIGADTRLNHRYVAEGGTLAEECVSVLQRFFQGLRRGAPTEAAQLPSTSVRSRGEK